MSVVKPIEELPFVGGHPALDFLNTAQGRDEPETGDALLSPADLRVWGQRQGILASTLRSSDSDRQELRRAIESREVLYRVFNARAHGQAAADADLHALTKLVASAHRAGELAASADGRLGWTWPAGELSSVRHSVVDAAMELLAAPLGDRLKQCPGDDCGWLFLDTTKRGNRRWCSMEECGQDAKVARRRLRHGRDYRSDGEPSP